MISVFTDESFLSCIIITVYAMKDWCKIWVKSFIKHTLDVAEIIVVVDSSGLHQPTYNYFLL